MWDIILTNNKFTFQVNLNSSEDSDAFTTHLVEIKRKSLKVFGDPTEVINTLIILCDILFIQQMVHTHRRRPMFPLK